MVHSKHGVVPGMITLAWPLKPSVPPSTIGLTVSSCGLSSESYSEFSPKKRKRKKKGKSMTHSTLDKSNMAKETDFFGS